MAEFVCPPEIVALFDDPATIGVGRKKAIEWAKAIDAKVGDEFWLPEIGWMEKIVPVQ